MAEQIAAESTETDETPDGDVETPETTEETPEAESETFPAHVVKELRKENATWRERTQAAEKRLHRALVEQTGRLADPDDLPFDATHLETPEALDKAIDALIESKPHFKARKTAGDIGQGYESSQQQPTDFSSLFR